MKSEITILYLPLRDRIIEAPQNLTPGFLFLLHSLTKLTIKTKSVEELTFLQLQNYLPIQNNLSHKRNPTLDKYR